MHRILAALCIVLLSFSPLAGQERHPVPFEDSSGLWGYRWRTGEVAIEPRFQLAGEFSAAGIAEAVDEEGWAIISAEGEVLLRPFIFDNGPDYFSEGLARFVENGRIGFFNTTGQVVIEPRFLFAEPFADGRAAFCVHCRRINYGEHWSMEGGLWGCIDRQGRVVRQPVPGQRDCSEP